MDGMSDIRNEIEQRLGVFARQSEKATMATLTSSYKANNLYKECVKWCEAQNERINNYAAHLQRTHRNDPVLTDVNRYFKGMSNFVNAACAKIPSSSGPQDVDNWLSNLRKFYDTLKTRGQTVIDDGFARVHHLVAAADRKKGYSRPGAKAEFGEHSAFVVWQQYDGSATGSGRGFNTLQQAHDFIKQRRAYIAAHADPSDAKKVSWVISKTISPDGSSQRVETVRFSRPGAKAKMAISATDPRRDLARQVTANPKKYALLMIAHSTEWDQIYKKLSSLADDALNDNDKRTYNVASNAIHNVIKAELAIHRARNSRPGAKATMGILDRISRGLSAATAKPVDPTTPQYLSGLTAAKKAAEEAKSNYEYMADLNDARFKQLDNYVKVTSNMITKMNSSADIQRLIAGLKAAVAARVFVQSSMKTPFSRLGNKTEFAEGCGSGAGGFKPGNTCGKEDGKASGGGAKKKKKPTSPKPATPRRQEVENRVKARQAEERARKRTRRPSGPAEIPGFVEDTEELKFNLSERKVENCNVDSKPLSYGKGCETEQDKAGLKLMEKADKAVSDKIRTLIKEGKPQDQAVAIALDMKRRGEL